MLKQTTKIFVKAVTVGSLLTGTGLGEEYDGILQEKPSVKDKASSLDNFKKNDEQSGPDKATEVSLVSFLKQVKERLTDGQRFLHSLEMRPVLSQVKERSTQFKRGLEPSFLHTGVESRIVRLMGLKFKPAVLNDELYKYMIANGPGCDVHNYEIRKYVEHYLMLTGREGVVRRETLRQPRVIDLKEKSVDNVLNFLWNARKYSIPDDMVKVSLTVLNATEEQVNQILNDENVSYIDETKFDLSYQKKGDDEEDDAGEDLDEDEDKKKDKDKTEDEDKLEEEKFFGDASEEEKFFDDASEEEKFFDDALEEQKFFDDDLKEKRLFDDDLEERRLFDDIRYEDEFEDIDEYLEFDHLPKIKSSMLPRFRDDQHKKRHLARRRDAVALDEREMDSDDIAVVIPENEIVLENVFSIQDKADMKNLSWKYTATANGDSPVKGQNTGLSSPPRSQSVFTPHTSHNYVHIFCRGRTALNQERAAG